MASIADQPDATPDVTVLSKQARRHLMRELATQDPGYALAIADQLRDLSDLRPLTEVEPEGGEPR